MMDAARVETPRTAYLDTNVFGHLHDRDGATDADESLIRAVVAAGSLRVVMGLSTLEEILAIVRWDAPKAAHLVQLAVDLADSTRVTRPPADLLRGEILAYAAGEPAPEPYLPVNPAVKVALTGLPMDVAAATPEVREVVRLAEQQKGALRDALLPGLQTIRAQRKAFRQAQPSFLDFRAETDHWLIEHFAERLDVLASVRARGIPGLAAGRAIRAAVGPAQTLMYAVLFEGRGAKDGDSRDMHHALSASPVDVFVTDDAPLRHLLGRIADLPYHVWNLADLIAWCRTLVAR